MCPGTPGNVHDYIGAGSYDFWNIGNYIFNEFIEFRRTSEKENTYDIQISRAAAEVINVWTFYQHRFYLFGRAYPYADLAEDDVRLVARYMHNRFPRLAWVSERDEVIIKPRGNRKTIYRYFFNTLSMIPDEKDYLVIDMGDETPVGILHEAFVAEYARPGVKFIIRGSPWKILNIHNDKIYVRAEDDPTGAIPSWVGEEIPVPLEVALEVGAIKAQAEAGLGKGLTVEETAARLKEAVGPGFDELLPRPSAHSMRQASAGQTSFGFE